MLREKIEATIRLDEPGNIRDAMIAFRSKFKFNFDEVGGTFRAEGKNIYLEHDDIKRAVWYDVQVGKFFYHVSDPFSYHPGYNEEIRDLYDLERIL